MLEMAKMRVMRVFQTEPAAPIYLEYRVVEDSDAVMDLHAGLEPPPEPPAGSEEGQPSDPGDAETTDEAGAATEPAEEPAPSDAPEESSP